LIFRLSQKLNAKLKVGQTSALLLHDNPFADWSAHVFVAGRSQYVILSNTKSLYSTVLHGKGITDASKFIDRALSSIREFIQDDGREFVYRRLIAPATRAVRFAKALDRSVTGSMNDLINHATGWLAESELSPHDVGTRLNDTLLSALGPSRSDKYGKPREAFTAMVESAEL
jgi:hypothetical protein